MVFESLLTISRPRTVATTIRPESPSLVSTSFALDGGVGDVYNEEAFRHFLTIERMRAVRSERPFLLLLVSLRKCPKAGSEVPRSVSGELFSALGLCVREIDFIGWYREGQVAGAVLAQGLEAPGAGALARIVDRVTSNLRAELPAHIAGRLRVRVVRLGYNAKS
jgi:hypothetical protein